MQRRTSDNIAAVRIVAPEYAYAGDSPWLKVKLALDVSPV
jgi:hypothetical protein